MATKSRSKKATPPAVKAVIAKVLPSAAPVHTGEVHAHAPSILDASTPESKQARGSKAVDYSTMTHDASTIAAAGLRNGMQPHEVHAAIARVKGV